MTSKNKCRHCGKELPENAHENRRYCNKECLEADRRSYTSLDKSLEDNRIDMG